MDEKNESNMDEEIVKRLVEALEEYGLSNLGKQIAMNWIARAATDTTGHLRRLKTWFLMLINKKRIPATVSPWQYGCPGLFAELRSVARWNTNDFEWVKGLEAAFPEIKQELLSLRGKNGFQQYRAPSWAAKAQSPNGEGSISHEGGDWNVFYLFLHNMDFEENRKKCPITVSLIESIPSNYSHAFFSALAPDTHITKHHGPTNKKLRCHLPLVVPEGKCYLRVGENEIHMQEGKCFIFDDSFEHEAFNTDPNKSRIVLIIDVWHPDFHPQERKFLTFLQKAQLRQQKRHCTIASDSHDNFYSIITKAQKQGPLNPSAIWA